MSLTSSEIVIPRWCSKSSKPCLDIASKIIITLAYTTGVIKVFIPITHSIVTDIELNVWYQCTTSSWRRMLERDGLHRTYGQSSPIKPRSKFSDIFFRFLRLTNGGARCLHFLYLLPPFFSLKASTRHPNLLPQPITSSPRKSFESAESTGRFNFSL